MKIKIISTDFDGTLLNSNKRISENSKKELIKLKNNNYIIVGVTGRILETIKEDIDINLFNYIIFNNGVNILNTKNNEINYNGFIDKETAENITKLLTDYKDKISYATFNEYYNFPNYQSSSKNIKTINNLNEIEEQISKISIKLEDNKKIEQLKILIENNIKNINVFNSQDSFSTNKFLMIQPKNINKEYALTKLTEKLNIKREEVIFFGDGLNDLELISSSFVTVAMKNALPIIKEKAKFITTYNNDNDGVINFLKEHLKED